MIAPVLQANQPEGCPVNDQLPPLIGGILILIDLAIRITALIIVPRDRKPTAAMAWLLAIFLIPFVGIILFLLIGNVKLPKKRREKQAGAEPDDRRARRERRARGRPRRPGPTGSRVSCARTRAWAPCRRSAATARR